ncbi:hypothetical protein [Oceanospirillum beijerinckii]|uniref:hypothetical protein n=1 Tax=Oceanospirillum beijerinckii TaxID=64976 RepID=UPI00056CDBC8|nr:hypothetical protein [Oceanospirillum beijerinckii]
MTLQPAEVKCDNNGHWQHPDLPYWEGDISSVVMEDWLAQYRLRSKVLHLDQAEAEQIFSSGHIIRTNARYNRHSLDLYLEKGYIILSVHRSDEGTFIWLGARKY